MARRTTSASGKKQATTTKSSVIHVPVKNKAANPLSYSPDTAYCPPGSLTYQYNRNRSRDALPGAGGGPAGSQEDDVDYERQSDSVSQLLNRGRTSSIKERAMPEDWEKDEHAVACKSCRKKFTYTFRKHHCRNCGLIYCADCTKERSVIKNKNYHTPVRVCGRCYYSLNKGQELLPNMQLKHQISAMEDVSQALMLENQQLRSLIDNLEAMTKEQTETIKLLCKQDSIQQTEIAELQNRLQAAGQQSPSSHRVAEINPDGATSVDTDISGSLRRSGATGAAGSAKTSTHSSANDGGSVSGIGESLGSFRKSNDGAKHANAPGGASIAKSAESIIAA